MKFLADENFPLPLISYLQRKRHNVKRVQRNTSGISDLSVQELATKENRIILTFDKDFLKSELEVSTVVFEFHDTELEKVLPYLDQLITEINRLKKKKKPFIAIYSAKGLKISNSDLG